MSIESTLERQAVALESIAGSLKALVQLGTAQIAAADLKASPSSEGVAEKPKADKPAEKPKAEETRAEEPKAGEAKAEEPKADKPKKASIEDVRNALRDYAALEGRPAAKEILKTAGGVDAVADLPEDKYQAVINACNK